MWFISIESILITSSSIDFLIRSYNLLLKTNWRADIDYNGRSLIFYRERYIYSVKFRVYQRNFCRNLHFLIDQIVFYLRILLLIVIFTVTIFILIICNNVFQIYFYCRRQSGYSASSGSVIFYGVVGIRPVSIFNFQASRLTIHVVKFVL